MNKKIKYKKTKQVEKRKRIVVFIHNLRKVEFSSFFVFFLLPRVAFVPEPLRVPLPIVARIILSRSLQIVRIAIVLRTWGVLGVPEPLQIPFYHFPQRGILFRDFQSLVRRIGHNILFFYQIVKLRGLLLAPLGREDGRGVRGENARPVNRSQNDFRSFANEALKPK